MSATLKKHPIPGVDRAARVVVDCPHGTTSGVLIDGAGLGEDTLIGVIVAKHFSAEGCECTAELRAKYKTGVLLPFSAGEPNPN
jgi:hypothetical protein